MGKRIVATRTVVASLPDAFTPTGLTLPLGLQYDAWESLGDTLGSMGRSVQWWIGDWLLYGEHAYGEKYTQAASLTGFDPDSLKNFQWVAERVERFRRLNLLSWSHHQAVAALKPEQQDEWLQRAEDECWSVHELRRQIKGESIHFSSENDEWETPQALFDVLNREFQFTLDVCATPTNAKCELYYTPEMDGLVRPWTGVCWMNPPYGDAITAWICRAFEVAKTGITVVCLVPARTDTGWWWDCCRFGAVRFLRGRLRFVGAAASAPFPSAVVVFGPTTTLSTRYWEWRTD